MDCFDNSPKHGSNEIHPQAEVEFRNQINRMIPLTTFAPGPRTLVVKSLNGSFMKLDVTGNETTGFIREKLHGLAIWGLEGVKCPVLMMITPEGDSVAVVDLFDDDLKTLDAAGVCGTLWLIRSYRIDALSGGVNSLSTLSASQACYVLCLYRVWFCGVAIRFNNHDH